MFRKSICCVLVALMLLSSGCAVKDVLSNAKDAFIGTFEREEVDDWDSGEYIDIEEESENGGLFDTLLEAVEKEKDWLTAEEILEGEDWNSNLHPFYIMRGDDQFYPFEASLNAENTNMLGGIYYRHDIHYDALPEDPNALPLIDLAAGDRLVCFFSDKDNYDVIPLDWEGYCLPIDFSKPLYPEPLCTLEYLEGDTEGFNPRETIEEINGAVLTEADESDFYSFAAQAELGVFVAPASGEDEFVHPIRVLTGEPEEIIEMAQYEGTVYHGVKCFPDASLYEIHLGRSISCPVEKTKNGYFIVDIASLEPGIYCIRTSAYGYAFAVSKQDGSRAEIIAANGKKIYNVLNLVNGNLGDESVFDSCADGLKTLKYEGRINYKTIEMGRTEEEAARWIDYLYDAAESEMYDVIICGTGEMTEYVHTVAAEYPRQKFLLYDGYFADEPNILNINYKFNEIGYLVGVIAASMTSAEGVKNINSEKVIGFIGAMDDPIINDYLCGYILGAVATDPSIKIASQYVGNYVDAGSAKQLATAMINNNKCDIIWSVSGNAGYGCAEAAMEGNAWYIGNYEDQELAFPDVTLTSSLINIGESLIWFFNQCDTGRADALFGTSVSLGVKENAIRIVEGKNWMNIVPEEVQEAVLIAAEKIASGEINVQTTIRDDGKKVSISSMRDSLQP